MFRPKRMPASVLLVVVVLAVMPGLISADSGFSGTVVSGPSPFSNCDLGAGPGSNLCPKAEVEPWVAVNPANPKNIIGAMAAGPLVRRRGTGPRRRLFHQRRPDLGRGSLAVHGLCDLGHP